MTGIIAAPPLSPASYLWRNGMRRSAILHWRTAFSIGWLLAVSETGPAGRRPSGGRVLAASADGFLGAGLRALDVYSGRRKAGTQSWPERGDTGTTAPGHLVRVRPEICGPVEQPIATAH